MPSQVRTLVQPVSLRPPKKKQNFGHHPIFFLNKLNVFCPKKRPTLRRVTKHKEHLAPLCRCKLSYASCVNWASGNTMSAPGFEKAQEAVWSLCFFPFPQFCVGFGDGVLRTRDKFGLTWKRGSLEWLCKWAISSSSDLSTGTSRLIRKSKVTPSENLSN